MAATENTYILERRDTNPSVKDGDLESPISPADTKELMQTVSQSPSITSNLPQTSFNYINSIIGSGVIGIAYALHQSGFGLGLILLVLTAIATDYSLCILLKSANIVGATTYQDVVQMAFGKVGYVILTLTQFVYPFIAMISYNVIIGDTITKVLIRIFPIIKPTVLGDRNFVVFITTVVVTLPLSMYRHISKLSKASIFSLIGVIFIMGFVLYRIATMVDMVPETPGAYGFANTGVTQSIGVMAFAFMCHHNSFLLYGALESPSQSRWNRVTHISVSIAFVVIVVFGVGGYVTFKAYSQGDLLENYCITDDWANVARLLFTVTIMFTSPIECFVAREVVENTCFAGKQPSSNLRHGLVTAFIVFLAFGLSTLTDCLGIVLELNGVLAAVPLAYVLPALTYLKLEEGKIISWRKMPSLLLAIFGSAVAIVGIVVAIYNIADGVSCSHGKVMKYCEASDLPTTSAPELVTHLYPFSNSTAFSYT